MRCQHCHRSAGAQHADTCILWPSTVEVKTCSACGIVVEIDGHRQKPPEGIGLWTLCTHVGSVAVQT